MITYATIARPYANALFRIAELEKNLSEWSKMLSEMAKLVMYPDVKNFIQNQSLTCEEISSTFLLILRNAVNIQVIKHVLNKHVINLVNILVENNRLMLLPEIVRQFHILKNLKQGVKDIKIISAFTLSDIELKNIINLLEKKFLYKLNYTVKIDKKLIGGFCVLMDDQVLDMSIRARLQNLHTALAV